MPQRPDATDLKRAKQFIGQEWLADFPFVDDASRANAVAVPITAVARELVDGPTPLFTDIQIGDTICGLGSTYNDGSDRDRDWYRLSNSELDSVSGSHVLTVTASVRSEFDHSVRIMALGDPVCVNELSLAVVTAAGAPDICNAIPTLVSTTVVVADHPNGIAIIVYPNNPSTIAFCDANEGYILEVTCVSNDAS